MGIPLFGECGGGEHYPTAHCGPRVFDGTAAYLPMPRMAGRSAIPAGKAGKYRLTTGWVAAKI